MSSNLFQKDVEWQTRNDCQAPTDISLVLGEHIHKCHKNVLASSSGYFKSMFNGNFVESKANEVQLLDISNDNLKSLLKFAYTKELNLPTSDTEVHLLLHAAFFYQFNDVINALVANLIDKMTIKSCIENLLIGDTLAFENLRNCSKMFALWELFCQPDIADYLNNTIKRLPYEIFYEILSDNRLRVKDEYFVLLASSFWTENNEITEQQLSKLLACINVQSLKPDDLTAVKKQLKCAKIPLLELVDKNMRKDAPAGITRTLPLRPVLFTLDQTTGNERIVFNVMCDLKNFEWRELGYFPLNKINMKNIIGLSICSVGKDLYIFGGREYYGAGSWNTSLFKYDSFKKSFTRLSDLPRKLRHAKFSSDEKSIYVAGGYGAYRVIMNSLFRYDINDDFWTELPELPVSGSNSFTITVFEETLYLFSDGNGIYQLDQTLVPLWRKIGRAFELQGVTTSCATEEEIVLLSPKEDYYAVFHPENGVTKIVFMGNCVSWDLCALFNRNIFVARTDGFFNIYEIDSCLMTGKMSPFRVLSSDFSTPCVLPVF